MIVGSPKQKPIIMFESPAAARWGPKIGSPRVKITKLIDYAVAAKNTHFVASIPTAPAYFFITPSSPIYVS